MTMFDRIVMDVVEMPLRIALIPDRVFPEPALPDAGLSALSLRGLAGLSRQSRIQRLGELDLDPRDSPGEIGVAGGQRPKQVNVVGQDHRADDLEGTLSFDASNRLAEQRDALWGLEDRLAPMRHQREKKGPPGAWNRL